MTPPDDPMLALARRHRSWSDKAFDHAEQHDDDYHPPARPRTEKRTMPTPPALKTRRPTGIVPWPVVLIEGAEKSGKSWAAAQFSASDKVGQTYWIDLGEGAADEYGAIPDARYLVVEHDGTWKNLIESVEAIRAEARRAADAGEPPVVLVIDSMTAEWELLKDWAGDRAKGSASNRKKLQQDPNAEVSVPMNLWNDATSRHRRLMTMLLTFPGIVVLTARGKEVASLDENGRPVEGTKTYKVEGHKTLGSDATVWVRMSREHPPMIIGARSVHAGVRPGVDEPKRAPKFTLEWLVFEVLRCDPGTAKVRDLTEAQPHEDNPPEDQEQPHTGEETARAVATEVPRSNDPAKRLLDAPSKQAAEWWRDKITKLGDQKKPANRDVIATEDLETLGMAIDEPVLLGDLAKEVVGYWTRRGFGPRMDGPAEQPKEASDTAASQSREPAPLAG